MILFRMYPRQTLRRVFLIETSPGANGHAVVNSTLLNLNIHTHLRHWKVQMLAEPPVLIWSKMIKSNLILHLLQIKTRRDKTATIKSAERPSLSCLQTYSTLSLSKRRLAIFPQLCLGLLWEKSIPASQQFLSIQVEEDGWWGWLQNRWQQWKYKKKNCMSFLQDMLANEEYRGKAVTQ